MTFRGSLASPLALVVLLGGCAAGASGGGRPPAPAGTAQSAAAAEAAVAAFASICGRLDGAAIAREAETRGFRPADDTARLRLVPNGQGEAWTRASPAGADIVRWREQGRVCEFGAGGFGRTDAEAALSRFAVGLRASGELVGETTLNERQRSYVVRPAGTPTAEAHVVIATVVDNPRSTISAFMSRRPAAPPPRPAGAAAPPPRSL